MTNTRIPKIRYASLQVNPRSFRIKLVKLGKTNPANETPTEAIPRALPVYFLNQTEISLDTAILPIIVTPKAIGKVKIIRKKKYEKVKYREMRDSP